MGSGKGKTRRAKSASAQGVSVQSAVAQESRVSDEEKPEVFVEGGVTQWRLHGELHRVDGPAIKGQGYEEWYINGKVHRDDGPAKVDSGGRKEWYKHGKRHREDGPAVQWADGTCSWFLDDEQLSEEEVNEIWMLKNLKKIDEGVLEKVTF
jgi:hypothetical protein